MTDNDPPYLRIAADLRRRIADGDLAPGDRLPSTRQLARDWDVALATATKALTVLQRDGMVHAQPRVGNVVAGARRDTPVAEHELTRERIVRAAIDIADAEGLDALSMRGVAARLGVATMSPYRHVTGKDDLVALMADAAFGELGYPPRPPDGWRAQLELASRTLWSLYKRHPWLAQLGPLNRPLPLPNLTVHAEWVLRALDGHRLDTTTMFNLHVLLYSYVHGFAVNLEREAQARAATGLSDEEWLDTQAAALDAITASGRYPTFAKVLAHLGRVGYDLDLDELFELGLRPLLDGLTPLIEGRPA
jgi:DNA-binding transcriptional regulator YhcF (GntR family)